MAQISAFKGWRYHSRFEKDIAALTSPLFDVVDIEQRNKLYQNPYNSIHLSVPNSIQPAHSAADLLSDWKTEKIIVQDKHPSLYGYYQTFKHADSPTPLIRKGFVAMLDINDWDDPRNQILRHENTIPLSVNDRVSILEKTRLHASPTHGLYTDPEHIIESILDQHMSNVIYESKDYQGVIDTFCIIDDTESISLIRQLMKNKTIILADGHHRYEASLQLLRDHSNSQNSHICPEKHMMFFSNTESDDIRILPTHRIVSHMAFDTMQLIDRLEKFFHIEKVPSAEELPNLIRSDQWSLGVITKPQSFKIRLKGAIVDKLRGHGTNLVEQLDLVIMHDYVIDRCLDIPLAEQNKSSRITYERNLDTCIETIKNEEDTLALITKEIPIQTVIDICNSGYLMPQKSTYFYPKLISGFVFGSIDPDEQ